VETPEEITDKKMDVHCEILREALKTFGKLSRNNTIKRILWLVICGTTLFLVHAPFSPINEVGFPMTALASP